MTDSHEFSLLPFLFLPFCAWRSCPRLGQPAGAAGYGGRPAPPLSLQQAIAEALQHNYGILLSRQDEQIARNNVTRGNAGQLPNVNANLTRTFNNNNITSTIGDNEPARYQRRHFQPAEHQRDTGLDAVRWLGDVYCLRPAENPAPAAAANNPRHGGGNRGKREQRLLRRGAAGRQNHLAGRGPENWPGPHRPHPGAGRCGRERQGGSADRPRRLQRRPQPAAAAAAGAGGRQNHPQQPTGPHAAHRFHAQRQPDGDARPARRRHHGRHQGQQPAPGAGPPGRGRGHLRPQAGERRALPSDWLRDGLRPEPQHQQRAVHQPAHRPGAHHQHQQHARA